MPDFIIENNVKEDNVSINRLVNINKKINPRDQLQFARYILFGLGSFYLISICAFVYLKNEDGKFLFLTINQLITNFGAFIIGHYFSLKGK